MNDSWKRIAQNYIDCYETVNLLRANEIIDGDDAMQCHSNLLKDIIEDFRSEVEE